MSQCIEHQDHVGIPLLLVLGDVEPSEPNRGPPVDVFDPIPRRERPDVSGFQPLSERGGHVVSNGSLGAARLEQAAEGKDARIHTHGFRIHMSSLQDMESGLLPDARIYGAELEAAASQTLERIGPPDLLPGAQAEQGPVTSRHQDRVRGERLTKLQKRNTGAGGEGRRDAQRVALEGPFS